MRGMDLRAGLALAAGMLICTAVAGANAAINGVGQPVHVNKAELSFDHAPAYDTGKVLYAPKVGADKSIARHTDPNYMSIRFADLRVAKDYWHESMALGESACINDLGFNEGGGRYWLHSC